MGYGETFRKKGPAKPKDVKCWACKGSGKLLVGGGGRKGHANKNMGHCPTCRGKGTVKE